MISLEIAISNFKSINYQEEPITSLTLKFGEISTSIALQGGAGGKCLYLSLSAEELQDLYLNYACGLFILSRSGKFFSLLSLEKLKVEDKIICNEIPFFNDLRQTKYHCQFSLVAKGFKNPKVADTAKLEARENALNMLKKPPIPKQSPKPKQNQNKKQVTSFLYGNKGSSNTNASPQNFDNLQTLKEGMRKQSEVKAQLQKAKNNTVQWPRAALAKQPEYLDEDELFESNPPMMEFTNDEPETTETLRVPQVDYIQYEESVERSKQSRSSKPPKQNNFLTFNKYGNEAPSELKQVKNNTSRPVKKQLSKQEIKLMAKEEVDSRQTNENIMIPIARGSKFELLPLSALKPEQIIDYVHKQRKNEEEAIAFQMRKKQLQQKQRELEEKNRKLQQLAQKREADKDKDLIVRRPSKQIRESVHKQIKEEENDSQEQEEQQNEDDYMSDFESMSASNSIIKSRLSSRNKNISKEEESIMEDEYSNDFDSYSHSVLSKTNPKNPTQSISDYSQSYRSISQSYRK